MAATTWNNIAAASHRSKPLRAIDRTIALDPKGEGGLVAIRGQLLPGAGNAAEVLLPIALVSVDDDAELAKFIRRAVMA